MRHFEGSILSEEGVRIVKRTTAARHAYSLQVRVMEQAMADGSWWTPTTEGLRGEQLENPALPVPDALRGDVPLSKASVSEAEL